MTNMTLEKKVNAAKFDVIIPIDTVDDIFSDFDFRDFTMRRISDDFIKEIKQQCRESQKHSIISITIMAPKSRREKELNRKMEQLIRQRIRTYFKNEYDHAVSIRRSTLIQGALFIVAGIVSFFLIKFFGPFEKGNLFISGIFDLVTFFSWFSTWHGIDILGDIRARTEIKQIRRISKSEIGFKYVATFENTKVPIVLPGF